MKMDVTVSGKTVTATLMDDPTAKDFVSLLPHSHPPSSASHGVIYDQDEHGPDHRDEEAVEV